MPNLRQINSEIDLTEAIKNLSVAYEEISVMKMQKIRNNVLSTRQFYGELSQLYYIVKTSYRNRVLKLMRKKKIKDPNKLLLFAKNGKTVSVLLSPNTKLYGVIINEICQLFAETIKKTAGDVMVVGRVGKEFIDNLNLKMPYTYFDIPEMEINLEDLKPIVYHLVKYETINVFYGEFTNLVYQKAKIKNISGDQPLDSSIVADVEKKNFLFEPSLEKILEFFETQIFSAFFKQTIEEGQLAKFASRITAMEQALEHIEETRKNLYQRKRQLTRLEEAKRGFEQAARIFFSS